MQVRLVLKSGGRKNNIVARFLSLFDTDNDLHWIQNTLLTGSRTVLLHDRSQSNDLPAFTEEIARQKESK